MMNPQATVGRRYLAERQKQQHTTVVFAGRETIVDDLQSGYEFIEDTEIWLDFSNVEIVNSFDLSALIRFRLRMMKLGKSIRVCNVGPFLEEIFTLTRFPPRESFAAGEARRYPPKANKTRRFF